jgi:hypothetical protein
LWGADHVFSPHKKPKNCTFHTSHTDFISFRLNQEEIIGKLSMTLHNETGLPGRRDEGEGQERSTRAEADPSSDNDENDVEEDDDRGVNNSPVQEDEDGEGGVSPNHQVGNSEDSDHIQYSVESNIVQEPPVEVSEAEREAQATFAEIRRQNRINDKLRDEQDELLRERDELRSAMGAELSQLAYELAAKMQEDSANQGVPPRRRRDGEDDDDDAAVA